MPTSASAKLQSVFLNVPFDKSYEQQFLALVSAIVLLGRRPRCVLEIEESGVGRLNRLFQMLKQCRASIHDLSRVGTPVRFNMPFELGLACAIAEYTSTSHQYFVFEKKAYRLQHTLSDLNGRDPVVHDGTIRGTLRAVFEVLRAQGADTRPADALALYRDLSTLSAELKKAHGHKTVFSRVMFQELVAGAVKLAERRRLLAVR